MKNKKLLCAICILLFGCNSNGDGRESFGDKTEWSILQTIESEIRDQKNQEFKIVEKKGYFVAVFPDVDTDGTILVMLNPHSAPFYKQMPSRQFNISKDQFDNIIKGNNATSTVLEALASHISK